MQDKNTILLELEQISPAVANLNRDNIYSVPIGYFNGLPESILAEIKIQTMFARSKDNIYATPNGYFNGLAENILSMAKQQNNFSSEVFEELSSVAPILNTIGKENFYALPNGYFEELNIVVPLGKPAKIIAVTKWKKIATYAAAAVFAGVLAVGGIKYAGYHSSKNIFEKEVAKSSDEELRQIIDNHSSISYTGTDEQDGASIFEGTSVEELQQFLKEQPETAEKSNNGI